MPTDITELSSYIIYLIIFLFGISAGNFLTVCIYRIPLHISAVRNRSFCPSCRHSLNVLDLMPLLGFLSLKGRCRYCGHRIPLKYPAVELLNGLLYLSVFHVFGPGGFSVILCLLFSTLIVIAFIDQIWKYIPNRVLLCLLALSPFFIQFLPTYVSPAEHAAGFFAVSIPMLLLACFLGGFGGGDIKLMAVCGLMIGTRLILVAAAVAILSGAVYCFAWLAVKKTGRRAAVPYAPFLSAGIICACLYGPRIIQWYLTPWPA